MLIRHRCVYRYKPADSELNPQSAREGMAGQVKKRCPATVLVRIAFLMKFLDLHPSDAEYFIEKTEHSQGEALYISASIKQERAN